MKLCCRFTVLILVLIVTSADILACTTFCLKNKDEVLFGKNYDWMIGDGLIFVNKRGVAKSGTDTSTPAKWTSKYGSVTFNQYGRENPSGGMNEAGLVIELMWLEDTVYPKAYGKPVVDVLEWIQYNLDNYATVGDVVRNAESTPIVSSVKIHYLVNDKHGNSATIEFLDGKFVPHTGESLPVAALANDTYAKSLEFSKKNISTQGIGSFQRFTRAAEKTRDYDKKPRTEKESVDYAFETLADVAQPGYTQWSIVYDQKRARIYFRTQQSPEIKTVDTRGFDYSCSSMVRSLDIATKTAGDVTSKFVDYTRAANRDLVERAFTGTPFLKGVPSAVKDRLASYPETFQCATPAPASGPKNPDSKSSGMIASLGAEIIPFFVKMAYL